jgi:hypothetical protein
MHHINTMRRFGITGGRRRSGKGTDLCVGNLLRPLTTWRRKRDSDHARPVTDDDLDEMISTQEKFLDAVGFKAASVQSRV